MPIISGVWEVQAGESVSLRFKPSLGNLVRGEKESFLFSMRNSVVPYGPRFPVAT